VTGEAAHPLANSAKYLHRRRHDPKAFPLVDTPRGKVETFHDRLDQLTQRSPAAIWAERHDDVVATRAGIDRPKIAPVSYLLYVAGLDQMTVGKPSVWRSPDMSIAIGDAAAARKMCIDQEGRNRAAKIRSSSPRQSFLCI